MERIINGVSQYPIGFSNIEISEKYTPSVSQICSFLALGNDSNFPKCMKDMQEAQVTNQLGKLNQLRPMWPLKRNPRKCGH